MCDFLGCCKPCFSDMTIKTTHELVSAPVRGRRREICRGSLLGTSLPPETMIESSNLAFRPERVKKHFCTEGMNIREKTESLWERSDAFSCVLQVQLWKFPWFVSGLHVQVRVTLLENWNIIAEKLQEKVLAKSFFSSPGSLWKPGRPLVDRWGITLGCSKS